METNIINEHFRVIDEVKDCLSLFDKLNETLTASWDYMYEEAKKYYNRNGNLEIPKRYKTPDGYSLGTWILTQKRVYNGLVGGILTKERIDKLNAIGMMWESHRDMLWQRYFDAATEYSKIYGNLDIPALYTTDDGLKLGNWITNLRTSRKNGFNGGYLTADRIKALDEIGMIWKVADYMWQQYYGACLTYYGTYGNLDIPFRYVTGDGLKLGSWISNIRTSYKNGSIRLSEKQISLLNEIGMIWHRKHERVWNDCYKTAKSYFEMHGNLNVPVSYKTADGFALGKWIDRQRRNTGISKARKAMLDNLGMIWNKESSWDIRFELAKAYFNENGNLNISANYVSDGIWLGKWISEQKKKYRNGKLSASHAEQLETLNIDWNGNAQAPHNVKGLLSQNDKIRSYAV